MKIDFNVQFITFCLICWKYAFFHIICNWFCCIIFWYLSWKFFYLLFGCPMSNVGPLPRGEPHSPNYNHYNLSVSPKDHMEPRKEVDFASAVEGLVQEYLSFIKQGFEIIIFIGPNHGVCCVPVLLSKHFEWKFLFLIHSYA